MANVSASSDVQPLIEGYQNIDPRLYDILSRLSVNIADIQGVLFPLEEKISAPIIAAPLPDTPINLVYSTTRRVLTLTWNPSNNAHSYELRVGSNWDTADFITRTISEEVRLEPIKVGTTRYLLKSRNVEGRYSTNAASINVVIPPLGSVTIASRVIDNNVLLNWSEPTTTWDMNFYTVGKVGGVTGTIKGTFFSFFESAGGTFTYYITPTDIAGNVGPTVYTTLDVAQPTDYELMDYRVSLLQDKKVNVIPWGEPILGWVNIEPSGWDAGTFAGHNWTWDAGNTGKLLCCVDSTKTYEEHFITYSWDSPNAQVTAGYPIYIQPTLTNGLYQEVIDYGLVLNSIIFSMNYTLDQLTTLGTVSCQPSIEFSLDAISWTTPINGKSAFGESFRYVRATFNFTSSNDKALALFYNLSETLNVKYELDSGNIFALASDVNGTIVSFNKPFKDIQSITVSSTKATEPVSIIYDFLDIPYPTQFGVYVFNSIGSRIDSEVSWKARGII